MILNDKEKFLLHYLNGRELNRGIDKPVQKLFEHYEQHIQILKNAGYLTDDDHSYFLEIKSIPELKKILKQFMLPTSGKRAELIERIKSNTTEMQRSDLCPTLYYVLTDKGIKENASFISQRKDNTHKLKLEIYNFIKSGDFKSAVFSMCTSYSQEVIPPGIDTDWNDKEQIWENQQKMLKQIQGYELSDLNNSDAFKDMLMKCAFYDSLIEHELWHSIDLFLGDTLELMNCKNLSCFFKKYNYDPSEEQKWYTYLSTKRYNSFQLNMCKTLKNDIYRPLKPNEFAINSQTVDLWKAMQEYNMLSQKEILNFPKTFQTFQKHKAMNDDKYKAWISH